MTKFAQGTEVPIGRTKEEIEKLLRSRAAADFMFAEADGRALLSFKRANRIVQIHFAIAKPEEYRKDPRSYWKERPAAQREAKADAENRRRWRVLLLVLKAKFEAVDTGLVTFEQEFLAHFRTADGRTVGDTIIPQLDTGGARMLLPGIGETSR